MPLTSDLKVRRRWKAALNAGVRAAKSLSIVRSGLSSDGRETTVLDQVRRDLLDLGDSTESAFLLVGERLLEMRSAALEIADRTSSISGIVSNDTAVNSIAVLDDVLAAAATASARDVDVTAAVQQIERNATVVRKSMARISGIVRIFDVLGVMTRIESTRVESSDADFAGLADDVLALSRQIRGELTEAAATAANLSRNASDAAAEIRAIAKDQRENLAPLGARVNARLLESREHRGRCAESARSLSTRFEATSRALGDVAAALQCHDITRQQIEHVVDALSDGQRSRSPLGSLVALQAAQLDNTRETFARSVDSIREALANIEHNVAEMSGEAARALGISGEQQESFFTAMQADLANILTTLRTNAAGDRRLAEISNSVETMLAEMTEKVTGVQGIGIRMQRIALNAVIQAARLGSQGGALEIVANSIQELARESGNICEQIDGYLDTMRKAASTLARTTEGGGASDEQGENLRKELGRLQSMHEGTHGSYVLARERTERLEQQVRETVAAFGTQQRVLDVLSAAAEALRTLSPDASVAEAGTVEETAALYTMNSERAVHQAVLRGAEAEPTTAGPAGTDDNVEFF